MKTLRAFALCLSSIAILVLPGSPVLAAETLPDAVVPVAGTTAGAAGANFRTEAQLHNPSDSEMTGRLVFVWQGIPIQPNPVAELDYQLAPRQTRVYEDLVAEMGGNGLGSIDLFALTGGVPELIVRAFDDQGENGTTGLMVPVLGIDRTLTTNGKASLVVPADLQRYRFNIGIRTLSSEDSSAMLRIVVRDGSGQQVGDVLTKDFPNYFFAQAAGEDFLGTPLVAGSSISFEVMSGRVILYSTTTDNTTNDGSIQIDRILNLPPVVDPAGAEVTTSPATPVTIPFLATDPDDDPIEVTVDAEPAHGTVTIATAEAGISFDVTYSPQAGFEGEDGFTMLFDDGNGGTTSVVVKVTVGDGNSAPIALGNAYTLIEGTTLNVAAPGVLSNDSDADGDTLVAVLESPPSHAASFNLSADGSLTYTPAAGFTGADLFTYRADDGQAKSNVVAVSIRVQSSNTAPTAVADTAATDEDTPVMIAVLSNDSDAETPGQLTLVGVTTTGTLGTATIVGTQVNYDPTASPTLQALAAGASTTDTFQYTARDPEGLTATTTVTVTVNGVDDLPAAANDATTVNEDAIATAIDVLVNDVDPDGGPVTIGAVTQGASGTVVITGGGTGLTYQPNANFCGADSFTYTLNGGSIGTVNVTVNCVNDAPSFTKGADQTVLEDAGAQTVNGWATAISVGPANEATQTPVFVIDTNSNAALFSEGPSIDATGTLTYTPAANANGTATITLHIADDGGTDNGGVDASATQSFVMNVTAQNDNPTANDDSATVGEDSGATVIDVLANDDDAPDTGETLTITGVTQPAGGSVTFTANDVSFTPTANFAGMTTFTYTIADGNGGTATATVTVTVTAANDPPVNTVPATQTVDQLLTLTLSTGNTNLISIADLDAVTPQVTLAVTSGTLTLSGVAGLTFSSGDGTGDTTMTFTGTIAAINTALDGLVYDPVDTFDGSVTLTITTNDLGQTGTGGAQQDQDSVTINVTADNDPPVNSLPVAQTVAEDGTLTLSTGNTNALSISDPDAGSATVQVALTATNGTMTLFGTTGLSFVFTDANGTGAGDGTADATMTFRGTIAAINTALDGLQFVPTASYAGAASIQIVTNDLGNTGLGGPLTDDDTLDITVNAVNNAPVNTVPGAQTIDEDAVLTFTGGTLISVADDAGSNPVEITLGVTNGTLALSGLTGLSFTTGDGTADASMVFTGTLTDVNSALAGMTYTPTAHYFGSDTVSITTNDQGNTGSGGALSDTDTVAITINSVNDAPTDIALSNDTIDEDQAAGTAVGTLTTTDADTADTHTYSLVAGGGDTDNTSFQIVGGQLQTAAVLDFETQSSYSVRIRTTDNGTGNLTYEEAFTINLNNVNEAPTDIALSNASVAENQASGTAVGNFSTTDPDTADTFTYTLVAGTGGTDNASFAIVGNQLRTAAVFDFETKSSYSVRVRSTDSGALFFEEVFTISVTNENEQPTDIALSNASINENNSVNDVVGNLSTTDPDVGDTFTYSLVAGTGDTDNASFNILGNALRASASFNFEAKSSYSIRVRSTDSGGLFVEEAFTITIVNVPEAPVATADSFDTIGNTLLEVDGTDSEPAPKVYFSGNLLANDTDPDTGTSVGLTTTLNTATVGAVVTVNSDGTFTYVPPPGHTLATDSFTYDVSDGGLTGTGTVTINLFERVWYVDPNAGGGGTGTSTSPFNLLDALDGVGGAGDTDVAGDYIFVHDGTLNLSAPMEMEANQHLVGEGAGLSIPVNLNGTGSPWNGLSAGTRPQLSNATGNTVTVTTAVPVEIVGLSLTSSSGNAIDLTSAAALTGSSSLTIGSNVIGGATAEGIDVNLNGGTTGTLALAITGNSWNTGGTHTGNAIDVNRAAGTVQLNISNNANILSTAAGGINIVGGAAASTFITGFASNTVHQNTAGAGITISNATFDATAGGNYDVVSGGNTVVGASGDGVGTSGITLTTVSGHLNFTDLDIFATNGAGLTVTGTGALAAASGTQVTVQNASTSVINATNGPAVSVSSATLNTIFDRVTSANSGTTGVSLTTVGGTFTAGVGSAITNAVGTDFNISGGSANVTYNGTISDASGTAVAVASSTGGTKTFGGAISSGAILLTNNTGATINFTGGLTLSTGTAAAFTATGGGPAATSGGTVNVTGTNTLTTTTGTALNVAHTTIGASGLTFRSIAANGATNGIVLNNTGSSGGLTVAGNGAAGTGGTIQNTTGVGILLTSTQSPTFNYLNIQASGDDGIRGSVVNNMTLSNCSLTNNGNATAENGLQLGEVSGSIVGITGTLTISNTSISGSASNNVHIRNPSGTLTAMNVTGSSFNNLNDTTGANAFLFEMSGTAVTSAASISNSTFSNNSPQRALEVQAHETAMITSFSVTGCAFDDNGIHASFTQDTSANLTFTFSSNGTSGTPMGNATLHGLNIFSSATSIGGILRGRVENNFIGGAGEAIGGNGIRAFIQGRTVATLLFSGNVIRNISTGARGIEASFLGPTAGGQGVTQSDITITNNDVNTQAAAGTIPLAAIAVLADDQGSPARVRANISANSAQNSVGGGSFDYPGFDGSSAHLIFVDVGGSAEAQLVGAAVNATTQLTTANPGAVGVYTNATLIAGPISTPP